MNGFSHQPVMLAEVLRQLAPERGGIYVDGTFGAGGYARAILDAGDGIVWGIDRDPEAIRHGEAVQADFPRRLHLLGGCFGDAFMLLQDANVPAVDGFVLDLGVSSPQLDTPERGFSFRADGPLDMRMTPHGPTAADLINQRSEAELADIIFYYGEERHARRIARAIIRARSEKPIARTLQLAELIRAQVPRGNSRIDPATRTFQALRIAVNDELGELERGLAAAEKILKPAGRLVVVSFHSLEDRIVKNFLRERHRHIFQTLTPKPVTAPEAEATHNPRARSAKLRAAMRLDPSLAEAA